jgi:enoyl-CoA hydratase/carnithine racemase
LAEPIKTSDEGDGVVLLRLDRPEARNALDPEAMERIAAELERLDPDPEARCVVIAGSEKVFAAGADIRSMAERTLPEALYHPAAGFWKRLAAVKTPMIAAVSGFALGGGCELALACDMIVAAEGARFGQPEVNLGIIPGGGGTQRLARTIGKQRAMKLVLTGELFGAETAREWGLVNVVAAEDRWLEEALELAREVASRAPLATRLGKQAVLAAEETALSAGLDQERRLFEIAMATGDRVEGMKAFLEKRDPEFKGE